MKGLTTMKTNRTKRERVAIIVAVLIIVAAMATLFASCVPEHVPGPTPAGRQKGNVPPKVTKEPLPVVLYEPDAPNNRMA